MGHDHAHGHAGASERALLVAFCISAGILLAEVVGAVVTGSLALLVDAGHMVVDTGGLGIGLVATRLARRSPTAQRTWGYQRAEVLGATAQAAILLAVGVFVVVSAVQRLFVPAEIHAGPLLVFGVVGLVGNLVAYAVLARASGGGFTSRAARLEVLNDTLGSVAVIAAAVVLALTGWERADSIAAILIGLLILPRAVRLLRETANVLLESTPPGLDLDDVRAHILELDHVIEVHDLHATLVATGVPNLTAHVVVDDHCFSTAHAPRILDALQQCVAEHFDVPVEHSTFQLEPVSHRRHEHEVHA
ncbi:MULTISPECIES: cation diffusion facilitator family transporter [unclassified Curtobacterium]|uniref:cation diffusion facilitator family transporter n=1 Tax=unclassified Curtobacterium TaxID=257496 RepID=UPI00203F8FDB|nr:MULTISPECIES: cation diffusion facilitator family transporter [unclassified Curtobacterium]MCM3503660.1 cation diffusion facilitator family transporter [Curtobacterium sp. ODYSSEY 48 V2]MCM3521001.1 cation diffusion facilitator family transporter [Curtobacterium sp. P97]MDB6427966.1 cation diffusion facilitator family transporter [Curtobacterium sp. 20TX0008]